MIGEPPVDRRPYLGLRGLGTGEYSEKRSRFVGRAFPVASEAEALERLAGIRASDAGAAHFPFAWVIGPGGCHARASDDGEPSGTGGLPLLQLLNHRGLRDAMVVVSRFYGGVKLGTGGLSRAFGRAAADALDAAGSVRMVHGSLAEVLVDYPDGSRVSHRLEERGATIDGTDYGERVTIRFFHAGEFEPLAAELRDLTAGRAQLTPRGHEFRPE